MIQNRQNVRGANISNFSTTIMDGFAPKGLLYRHRAVPMKGRHRVLFDYVKMVDAKLSGLLLRLLRVRDERTVGGMNPREKAFLQGYVEAGGHVAAADPTTVVGKLLGKDNYSNDVEFVGPTSRLVGMSRARAGRSSGGRRANGWAKAVGRAMRELYPGQYVPLGRGTKGKRVLARARQIWRH